VYAGVVEEKGEPLHYYDGTGAEESARRQRWRRSETTATEKTARTSQHALARHQVRHQPQLERLRRIELAVINPGEDEVPPVERDQVLHLVDVVLPDRADRESGV